MNIYLVSSILTLNGSNEQFNTCAKVYAYTSPEALELAKNEYENNNLIVLYSQVNELSESELELVGDVRTISKPEKEVISIEKIVYFYENKQIKNLLNYGLKFKLSIRKLLIIIEKSNEQI